MRLRFTLGLAISGALALGCTTQIPQGPADSDRFGEFPEAQVDQPREAPAPDPVFEEEEPQVFEEAPSEVQVIDAAMRASFTTGLEVSGDATELTTWFDYGFTEVDVIRDEAAGAAMGLIFIGGDLDSPVFTEVGARTVFRQGIMVEGPEGADTEWVDYTACAGPDVYLWDIDQPADEVVVTVDEGPTPDDRVVTIQAIIGPDASVGRTETQLLLSR